MNDPLDGTMGVVADRIGAFGRACREFRGVRHELARNRVVRVGRINQGRNGRRDRHGIARGDRLERGEVRRPHETGGMQLLNAVHGFRSAAQE